MAEEPEKQRSRRGSSGAMGRQRSHGEATEQVEEQRSNEIADNLVV